VTIVMERLITLLCDHWAPDEFHRILVTHGGFGAGEGLRHDLLSPKDARPSQFYFEIVALLRRHKAINRRFFAALRRSRPLVESDVRRLEASLSARRAGRSARARHLPLVATVGVMLAALVSLTLYSCSPADAPPPADHFLSKSMLAELMQ
jgi:hypothetical protein